MYLTPKNNNYYILDIECDSFKPTKIWCVCLKNINSDDIKVFLNQEDFISWLVNQAGDSPVFIGHNAISFDVPVLNLLWNTQIDVIQQTLDTLVLSYLYNPAIADGHSLEAWGRRLKFHKTNHSDWSQLSDDMIEYCKQDVRLTDKLYKALTEKMKRIGYSELSAEIEHKIRHLINKQEANGFWFNRLRAESFRQHLRELQSGLTGEIQTLFPPLRTEVARFKYRETKDGRPTASYQRHLEKYREVVLNDDGTYSCFEDVPFNIGSPKQRVERLLSLGWKPEKFTDGGFPKVDEDALIKFSKESGLKEVQAMSEWLVLQGRASMLDTWFNNLGDDSRIHGKVLSCGASTRRMVHSKPNSANIPSGAKAKYGKECRSFWGVEPGKGLVLIGYDAAGLETAGLCHYLNNPVATEILLRPKPNDVHTANARLLTEILGREIDREWGAKTSWYAWLYGAYPKKLGEIVKGPPSDGEKIIEAFFKNVPGLEALIESVKLEWRSQSGRLLCIDGGYVICPSLNAALNYKIQSAGTIVCKLAAILLDEKAAKEGLWNRKVGDIHDEGQLEGLLEQVYIIMVKNKKDELEELKRHPLGDLAVKCITEAGEILKFNIPLSGDYKVGTTWDETH